MAHGQYLLDGASSVRNKISAGPHSMKLDLDNLRKKIEVGGTARQHGDKLEKRGIFVDVFLNPSSVKDMKNIQYYSRIDARIKQKFLERGRINAKFTKFSATRTTYKNPGQEWDELLSKWIKQNRPSLDPISPSQPLENVAARLISCVEQQHGLTFLDSKFPLFGFMKEVAKDQKKHPKLCLWQGEADAIAYSSALGKYIIVDFKVVDNLLDYCQKKTDLCGKHLHQCLIYAKLLKLQMGLPYLPPSLIVAIDRFTGKDGYFPLFEDYPDECEKRLDEFEWFKEQPQKHPLKIDNAENLLNPLFINGSAPIYPYTRLRAFFNDAATVDDLLDLLGYDGIEIVPSENSNTND